MIGVHTSRPAALQDRVSGISKPFAGHLELQ